MPHSVPEAASRLEIDPVLLSGKEAGDDRCPETEDKNVAKVGQSWNETVYFLCPKPVGPQTRDFQYDKPKKIIGTKDRRHREEGGGETLGGSRGIIHY